MRRDRPRPRPRQPSQQLRDRALAARPRPVGLFGLHSQTRPGSAPLSAGSAAAARTASTSSAKSVRAILARDPHDVRAALLREHRVHPVRRDRARSPRRPAAGTSSRRGRGSRPPRRRRGARRARRRSGRPPPRRAGGSPTAGTRNSSTSNSAGGEQLRDRRRVARARCSVEPDDLLDAARRSARRPPRSWPPTTTRTGLIGDANVAGVGLMPSGSTGRAAGRSGSVPGRAFACPSCAAATIFSVRCDGSSS